MEVIEIITIALTIIVLITAILLVGKVFENEGSSTGVVALVLFPIIYIIAIMNFKEYGKIFIVHSVSWLLAYTLYNYA